MRTIKKNGDKPAFPISEDETDRLDLGVEIYTGLTKREHFAGIALQGLIIESKDYYSYRELAEKAVGFADALLDELSKT
ncbi:MAG: hypothetical protein ACK45H_05120 [Bacteroidota bacterium]